MVKEFDERQKNFEIYASLVEEKQKYEAACLVIQRFFRKRKQVEVEKLAFKTKYVNIL